MGSISRSLIISITLHMVLGATSYALWQAIKTSSLSHKKLPRGKLLTAAIEFEPVTAYQTPPLLSKSKETKNIYPVQAHSSYKKIMYQNEIAHGPQQNEGSALSEIIPHQNNKRPCYPEEARLEGREAICIMRISIAPNGNVHKMEAKSDKENCPEVFIREAKEAIATWKFSTHLTGYVERTVPIEFKME